MAMALMLFMFVLFLCFSVVGVYLAVKMPLPRFAKRMDELELPPEGVKRAPRSISKR
ncbi:hypothetical protein R5M92_14120 [Halomonas sp. Bachu 37]|uniref:hypothetical protein n=1 Tax=Halomonas kashgarensis TaxID=3084920 RepID=UPI003217D713